MANYKVVLEIEIDANSPLDAAKKVQEWLNEADQMWAFYVQEEDIKQVFSVDLSEEDEDVVIEYDNYIPLIR